MLSIQIGIFKNQNISEIIENLKPYKLNLKVSYQLLCHFLSPDLKYLSAQDH